MGKRTNKNDCNKEPEQNFKNKEFFDSINRPQLNLLDIIKKTNTKTRRYYCDRLGIDENSPNSLRFFGVKHIKCDKWEDDVIVMQKIPKNFTDKYNECGMFNFNGLEYYFFRNGRLIVDENTSPYELYPRIDLELTSSSITWHNLILSYKKRYRRKHLKRMLVIIVMYFGIIMMRFFLILTDLLY